MDYETFGEHQWADSGIFGFLEALPAAIFDTNSGQNDFVTVRGAIALHDPEDVYRGTDPIS